MLLRFPATPLALVLAATAVGPLLAQEVNSNALSENGWFSDDTRADGSGVLAQGTNLISPTLTDDPEGGSPAAMSLFDGDILNQVLFGQAPGAVPAATHLGAVQLRIAPGAGGGKSQISHRKDDATGHGPGSSLGAGFTAEYSWMGDGTASVTASLKFGIKTSEFGLASTSSRTGENVWDKVLIYEPGNGNGKTSDGTWQTETIDFTTGQWWFFDRVAIGSSIGSPVTLSDMQGSGIVYSGSKTLADAYALMTGPGAIITSVQFGVGSGNAGANVYVNQLTTSAYRPGQTTTFSQPSPFDQNVTPEVIFGSGNANGGFTLSRDGGLELGLRSKQRYPAANIYNSNGDGSYTWNTGAGPGGSGIDGVWNFEWAVNTDPNGTLSRNLDELTYELGIDFDSSGATQYLAFDPITPTVTVPFFDHAIGDNSTLNGGGTKATDAPTYAALLGGNNVAQNSWRMDFFDDPGTFDFDPTEAGFYELYLAAFDGVTELARTEITVVAVDGTSLTLEADACQTDTDLGSFGDQVEVELWLRNPDDLDVTGFQSFLQFDTSKLTFEGAPSSYDNTTFDANIQPMGLAEISTGKLRLDGNDSAAVGASGDALLATLVFTAVPGTTTAVCGTAGVEFDPTQLFATEVSFQGSPLATATLDSVDFLVDSTAPVFGAAPDITQPADAGSCTGAVVNFTDPIATDNCDLTPDVVCSPASGSTFGVGTTTVLCTATDDCGNVSTTTFAVTVTATNAVQVTVHLPGSMPTDRCITFVANACGATSVADLTFVGTDPAVAIATVEIPCGVWTELCAKDEQHTQWDTTTLSISGANYVAAAPLVLEGGDTDNDGDIDINDVTLLLAQFGDTAVDGMCPWNGARDADFSNNTVVGSEDYTFLVDNWLTVSGCVCTVSAPRGDGLRGPQVSTPVRDAATAAADFNGDSRVDFRDVQLFEALHGLPNDLSERMRR